MVTSFVTISNHIISSFTLSILILILGGVCEKQNDYKLSSQLKVLDQYLDQEIKAIVEVKSFSKTQFGYKIDAQITGVIKGDSLINVKGIGALIYEKNKPKIQKGNHFLVHIKLSKIAKNKNPSSTNFQEVFAKLGYYYQAQLITGTFIPIQLRRDSLEKRYLRYRTYLLNILKKNIHNEDVFSIIAALTLGDKSNLNASTKNIFSNTGSIHILAVSGLHVGLIYSIIFSLIYWIPKNRYTKYSNLLISLSGIWGYCLLTGMSTSVTRAGLMFSLFLIGRTFGRFTNIYNLIGIAAFVILFNNPAELFTISFQFSFLALISILFFQPRISQPLKLNNKLFDYVWQLISVSLAAQILIAPLLIYYFNQISIYFWLSGVVAVPMAFIILTSTIIFLIGQSFNLAVISSAISYLLNAETSFLIRSMKRINDLPFCILSNIELSFIGVIIIYVFLLFLMLYLSKRKNLFLHVAFLLILLHGLMLIHLKQEAWSRNEFTVYHLYRKSLIHFKDNGRLREIYSSNIDNEDRQKLLSNYKREHYINDHSSVVPNFKKSDFFFQLNNHGIILNPSGKYLLQNRTVDYVIITENKKNMRNAFYENHEIGLVVIDGNIQKNNKSKLIALLNELYIPYYDTTLQGAFILEIKS